LGLEEEDQVLLGVEYVFEDLITEMRIHKRTDIENLSIETEK